MKNYTAIYDTKALKNVEYNFNAENMEAAQRFSNEKFDMENIENFRIVEEKNQYYIAGYLKGNEIGVIDLDGKLNTSDKLDFDSRMFFDSNQEAQSFIEGLQKEENHPDFNYQIEVEND